MKRESMYKKMGIKSDTKMPKDTKPKEPQKVMKSKPKMVGKTKKMSKGFE